MNRAYETVNDVRQDVDALVATKDLRIAGGSFYPHIKAFTFGLQSGDKQRKGDAICLLPGGWQSNSYWPSFMGEQTAPDDALKLRVIKGVGRLVLPFVGKFDMRESSEVRVTPGDGGSRPYKLINTSDELLVVHALSTRYPQNSTDINPSGTRELDGSLSLAEELIFTYGQTLQPDGTVALQWER